MMNLSFFLPSPRSRSILAAMAVVAGLLQTVPSLHAQVTTYTDKSTFLGNVEPGDYLENFDAFSGQVVPSPQTFSQGGFSYTLSDNDQFGIFYSSGTPAQGGVFPTTGNAAESFVITFTSGNVTAVGGTFFLTGFQEVQEGGGSVVATLNTGETLTLASTGNYNTQPFGGFTSTTPITSLTLTGPTHNNVDDFVFASLDNLYVGQMGSPAPVPEPGTWALTLGGIALFLGLRRRAAGC